MPIDEEPSGPVRGPIKGKNPDLDKRRSPCSDDNVHKDYAGKIRYREQLELEQMFDPNFDEEPDAWNWEL